MYNLANTYNWLNRLDEAVRLYEDALDIRKRVLQSNHPKIGNTMYNLALTYHRLGRFQDALTQMEEALAVHKRAYPPGHSKIKNAEKCVAMCRSNITDSIR